MAVSNVGTAHVKIVADTSTLAKDIEAQLMRAQRGAQTAGENIGKSMRNGMKSGLGDPSSLMDGHLANFEKKGEATGDRFGKGFLTGAGKHFKSVPGMFDFKQFGRDAANDAAEGFGSLDLSSSLDNAFANVSDRARQAGEESGRSFGDGMGDGARDSGRGIDFNFSRRANSGGRDSGGAFWKGFEEGKGGDSVFGGMAVGMLKMMLQLNIMQGAMTGLIGAAVSLGNSLIAVGSSAAAAAPALLQFGNVVSAVAQGAIVLKTLFGGVSQAMGAYTKSMKTAGKAAKTVKTDQMSEAERLLRIRAARLALTEAILDGARKNADAIEAITDAQEDYEDALEAVADAEEDLADAMRDEQKALNAINDAREEAQERLEDLALALERASLNEERAALNLRDAEEKLARARAGGNTRAIEEADLAYREQLQSVKELAERNGDLREEANEAQMAGVDGAAGVVDAQEDYRDAVEATADAQEALRDALEAVSDAQRDLNRAIQDQPLTAKKVALDIAQAQLALERALLRVPPAASAAVSGMDALNDAFSKLSPAAQNFVRFMVDRFMPAMQEIKELGQEAFFPQLQEGLEGILESAGAMDLLTDAVVGTSEVLGEIANDFLTAFIMPENLANFRTIIEGNIEILDLLGDAAVNLVRPLGQIFAATTPLAVEWAGSVEKATEKFSEWIDLQSQVPAGGKSPLALFFEGAQKRMMKFWDLLKNLGKGIVAVFQAALPAGDWMLDQLIEKTDAWQQKMKDNKDSMAEIFQASAENAMDLGELLAAIGGELFKLGANPAIGDIADAITAVIPLFAELSSDLLNQLAPAIITIIEAMPKFAAFFAQTGTIEVFANIVATVVDTLGTFFEWLSQFEGLTKVIGIVSGAAAAFGLFSTVIGFVIARISSMVGAITGLVGAFMRLSPAVRILLVLAAVLIPLFKNLWENNEEFRASIQSLVETFSQVFSGIMSAVMPVLTTLAETFAQFAAAILPLFADVIMQIMPSIVMLVETLGAVLVQILPPIMELVAILAGAFMDALQQLLPPILSLVTVIANVLVGALAELLPPLMEVIGAIAGAFIEVLIALLPPISQIIIALVNGLIPVVEALMPIIVVLGNIISQVLSTAITDILPIFMNLITVLIDSILPIILEIIPVISELATMFLGFLGPALEKILPPILEAAQMFGTMFLPVLTKIIPIIADFAMTLIKQLLPVIMELLPIILELAMVFIDALMPVIEALLPVILDLVTMGLEMMLPIIEALMPVIMDLVEAFLEIIKAILPLLPIIIDLVAFGIGILSDALVFIIPIIMKVIGVFQSIFMPIIRAVIKLVGWLATTSIDVFTAIMKVVTKAFRWIQEKWDQYGKPALDAVKNAFQGVQNFITGVVEGIGRVWSGIKSAMQGPVEWVVGKINSWLIDPINKILGFFGMDKIGRIEVSFGGKAAGGPVGQGDGYIRGPGGPTSDIIPTMLSNGEYVVRASSVGRIGQRTLDYINKTGSLPFNVKDLEEGGIGGFGFLGSIGKLLKKGAGAAIGSIFEAGLALVGPVKDTGIGKFIVGMIEYLRDKIKTWADDAGKKAEEKIAEAERKAAEAEMGSGESGTPVAPYTGKAGGWTYPLSRKYLWRTRRSHSPGVGAYDIGGDVGVSVLAVSSGNVSRSLNVGNTSYGQYIVVTHVSGQKSLYAHLSKRIVGSGAVVKTGQKMGELGNSGGSDGAHLHFELNFPRDAASQLKGKGVKGISVRPLAAGGIVQATPGGILAMLAEGGRSERVTPLDSQGRSATEVEMLEVLKGMAEQRGGDTFQVFPAPGMSERELAVKVSREVAFQHRRRS